MGIIGNGLIAAIAVPAAAEPPSDDAVWALAQRVNTATAYEAYLNRHPDGRHRDEAVTAASALPGLQAPESALATPGAAPPQIPPSYVCSIAMTAPALRDRIAPEEEQAFDQARRSNRLADFQAFVGQFPDGTCAEPARAYVLARENWRRRLVPITGFGPWPARRIRGLRPDSIDYPAAALRREESGRVTVEWDVAEDGFAESCRVVGSSGSASLDGETCRIATSRLLYDPARDASGTPIRSTDTMSISWRLPEPEPAPTE